MSSIVVHRISEPMSPSFTQHALSESTLTMKTLEHLDLAVANAMVLLSSEKEPHSPPATFEPQQPIPQVIVTQEALKTEEWMDTSSTQSDALYNKPVFDIFWSVAEERGYRYKHNIRHERHYIHKEMEDYSFPCAQDSLATSDDAMERELATETGAKLFLMADGHGGHEASRFFIHRARHLLTAIIDERTWDFDNKEDQVLFKEKLVNMFIEMDQEYCCKKIEDYRRFNQAEPEDKLRLKPMDDGCTFIANVFIKDWMINCNVGDSRTVVATRQPEESLKVMPLSPMGRWNTLRDQFNSQQEQDDDVIEEEEEEEHPALTWNHRSFSSPNLASPDSDDPQSPEHETFSILFKSNDHNMTHPQKIHHIHDYGGKFLTPQAVFLNPSQLPPPDDSPTTCKRAYFNLQQCRVYRPETEMTREIGISNKRTLNLSATMGDLLFKVEPAVLSCEPDIEFIKLPLTSSSSKTSDEECDEILIVTATDGIWDHLKPAEDDVVQSERVIQWVADVLDERRIYNRRSSCGNKFFYIQDSEDDMESDCESELLTEDSIKSASTLDVRERKRARHHPILPGNTTPDVQLDLDLIARSLVKREHYKHSLPLTVFAHSKTNDRIPIQRSYSLPSSLSESVPHDIFQRNMPEAVLETGLYLNGYIRYDDATALVMMIKKPH